jgi:hypothetical protein
MRRWVAVAIMALLLAACTSEPTPQDLAEAQRMRQETADAAAAAAQQRQAAAVEIEAAQRTLPARVARDAVLQLAIGIAGALGLGILVVGGALVLVEALRVRASVVYPNTAGQYPIVVRHSAVTGQTVVYDPARALGPVGIIQAPGRIAARLAGSEPRVSLPVGTDHRTQAQITTQAQAAGLIVAATRQGADPSGRAMTQPVVQGAFGGGALPPSVPDVVMLEPAQLPHIERLLGGVDDDPET